MRYNRTHLSASLAALCALAMAACTSTPQEPAPGTPPAQGLCNPAAAESMAGRERVTDTQAREITGALIVRQIQPGQPVTQDFVEARVTIETDPATDRIVRSSCG